MRKRNKKINRYWIRCLRQKDLHNAMFGIAFNISNVKIFILHSLLSSVVFFKAKLPLDGDEIMRDYERVRPMSIPVERVFMSSNVFDTPDPVLNVFISTSLTLHPVSFPLFHSKGLLILIKTSKEKCVMEKYFNFQWVMNLKSLNKFHSS